MVLIISKLLLAGGMALFMLSLTSGPGHRRTPAAVLGALAAWTLLLVWVAGWNLAGGWSPLRAYWLVSLLGSEKAAAGAVGAQKALLGGAYLALLGGLLSARLGHPAARLLLAAGMALGVPAFIAGMLFYY
ncbi:MAG: hypothetical protein OEZ59_12505 [Deltaproteobacteria bacterium]|nr:hypothetical protein [Deltaproteobacteria bacterium]